MVHCDNIYKISDVYTVRQYNENQKLRLPSDQFKYSIGISISFIHDSSLTLLDAGTLMKCDGVKPVLIGSKSDVNDLSSTANRIFLQPIINAVHTVCIGS